MKQLGAVWIRDERYGNQRNEHKNRRLLVWHPLRLLEHKRSGLHQVCRAPRHCREQRASPPRSAVLAQFNVLSILLVDIVNVLGQRMSIVARLDSSNAVRKNVSAMSRLRSRLDACWNSCGMWHGLEFGGLEALPRRSRRASDTWTIVLIPTLLPYSLPLGAPVAAGSELLSFGGRECRT